LRRTLAPGLVSSQKRNLGGGEKRPNMPSTEMDFDILVVGGINATALTKFIQTE